LSLETTALPTDGNVAASEQSTTVAAPATQETGETQVEGTKPEGEEGDKPKAEKTPEQREREKLLRRLDNKTKQTYQLRAELEQLRAGQGKPQAQQTQAGDDEPVTLSRAELQKMIAEQATKLAPTVSEQAAEVERRSGIVKSLAKQWGQEEFDAKASELDEVFDGLADRSGRPKPATDAIFDADDPKAVIEYLTDPDNADEADRIARLPATQAGRAIAKLEAKLEAAKKEAKPKASNAARPIEAVKGGGVPKGVPDPVADPKAYRKWANEQERAR
jgi:hypothetical protein